MNRKQNSGCQRIDADTDGKVHLFLIFGINKMMSFSSSSAETRNFDDDVKLNVCTFDERYQLWRGYKNHDDDETILCNMRSVQ